MTKTNQKPVGAETKSHSVEFKATSEGVIEAYAAAFGNVDGHGDVIVQGAFTKTITERKDKIKVLVNHDAWGSLPVGKPLTMIEDSTGLLTSTKMSKTQAGQDILTLASEGALTEMSIGYYALQAKYADDTEYRSSGVYRYLTEVKLLEYSFVTLPSNESAVITGIKSGADLEREIKRWTAITEVNLATKAGRTLSGANAKRIQSALKELHDLLAEAGVEEAAEGTSDDTTSEEKGSREPREHSSLLEALQQKNRQLGADEKKGSLLSELRSFGARLGGQA